MRWAVVSSRQGRSSGTDGGVSTSNNSPPRLSQAQLTVGPQGTRRSAAVTEESNWRRRPESNWGWRFCRPLPYHLATSPRPSRPDSTCAAARLRLAPTTLGGELDEQDF